MKNLEILQGLNIPCFQADGSTFNLAPPDKREICFNNMAYVLARICEVMKFFPSKPASLEYEKHSSVRDKAFKESYGELLLLAGSSQ